MIQLGDNNNNWAGRVEALQAKHGDEIQQYCYVHLANVESARDATQEVFCKLQMQGTTIITAERAWLYRCARNHCLDLLKKRSREAGAMSHHAQSPTSVRQRTSVLSGLVNEEVHQRLRELVDNLPLDLRVPLYLRYIEGFSRSEIVEILEWPEHRVKARLRRALSELRKHTSLIIK